MSNGDAWLSTEQQDGISRVAEAFGWDRMSVDEVGLLAWTAFHYYAGRIPTALTPAERVSDV